jgi:hypothetical protein
MIHSDIKSIAASFAHRNKTIEQYESYFADVQQGDRPPQKNHPAEKRLPQTLAQQVQTVVQLLKQTLDRGDRSP